MACFPGTKKSLTSCQKYSWVGVWLILETGETQIEVQIIKNVNFYNRSPLSS